MPERVPRGFPGGPHMSDPDIPRVAMRGDRPATIPETRGFWEDIIRGKDREAAGGGPVANDPRAHYGTEDLRLDDIYRRVESGEGITDAEGVEFLGRFNSEKDLRMLLEYINRAIKRTGQRNDPFTQSGGQPGSPVGGGGLF
jgi:hypothetical protein